MAAHIEYALVSAATTASAGHFVRRDLQLNGFEMYSRFIARYACTSKSRAATRLCSLLSFICKQENVEDAVAALEGEVFKYEKEYGSPLPDEVKVSVLMNAVSGFLRDYLRLQSHPSLDYR